jgi:dephospho-CoA kinase
MKIIGITGGVGSGKSRVLNFMETEYQAYICQADHVAWELQSPGTACYDRIVATFGHSIINEDRTINRKHLGSIVFADEQKLSMLNAIMHPAVKEEIKHRIVKEKENGTTLFLLEAALLLEDGYDAICDEIWYVYAEESVRKNRLASDRGYSEEKTDAIMKQQLTEQTFRERCQFVIDNSNDFAHTVYQIRRRMEGKEL